MNNPLQNLLIVIFVFQTKNELMKPLLLILILCLPLWVLCQTQDLQNKSVLASQYYQSKEYGKAAQLYEELYTATKSEGYFSIYLDCLLAIPDYDKAEKTIKKSIKASSSDAYWYVQWGYVKKQQGLTTEANKLYDQAIEAAGDNPAEIQNLSNQFINRREFDYAEKVYLKARKDNPALYNYELGRIYYYLRNYDLMLKEYLAWVQQKETNLDIVKSNLMAVLSTDNEQEISNQMKAYLLKRIQQEPSQVLFTRLLIWLFIQDKNFPAATRQAISLDKRTGQEDGNIFALANVSATNKNYDEAVKAYDYLIGKGKTTEYARLSYLQRMEMYYEKFMEEASLDQTKATQLREQFEQTFATVGRSAETINLQAEFAHLLVFYLNQPDQGIKLLTDALELKGINAQQLILLKTELSDCYVYAGQLWDAVITYSQVIESTKNNPLGDDVKFKKARLGYLMGNFKWAKAQLDVLKASTSKLIANDAMQLALFISENMEEDSVGAALQMFARADLQLFRNHYPEALAVLDSVAKLYPDNSLVDDVDYRKSTILQKEGKYEQAAAFLENIVKDYSWEMLADDALFELASLKETKLNQKQQAMELYKKILTDYPSSVYVVEARAAYRKIQESLETQDSSNPLKSNDDVLLREKAVRP
jgi:tetratricopeptide (TPR) repeat protein